MTDNPKTNYANNNKFYIFGDFDDDLLIDIIVPLSNKIDQLKQQKNAEIELHINSNGGCADVLFKLIDLVEMAKRNDIVVKTIVTLYAFSSGSLLAITGTKGERYISKNAEHLIHHGQFGGGRRQTALQIERMANKEKRWIEAVYNHYKEYCKIPKLREEMKDDQFYLPADKCIEYGLADKFTSEIK